MELVGDVYATFMRFNIACPESPKPTMRLDQNLQRIVGLPMLDIDKRQASGVQSFSAGQSDGRFGKLEASAQSDACPKASAGFFSFEETGRAA